MAVRMQIMYLLRLTGAQRNRNVLTDKYVIDTNDMRAPATEG